MTAANKQMNLPELQKNMAEFEKQSMQMEMAEDMMNDAIDGLDDAEDEEEGEDIMNQVLDEIGIDISMKMSNAPRNRNKAGQQEDEQLSARDQELLDRMKALSS